MFEVTVRPYAEDKDLIDLEFGEKLPHTWKMAVRRDLKVISALRTDGDEHCA